MTTHPVVSPEQWFAAHAQHLAQEKAVTRERDRLAAARRALPWMRIEKNYRFHDADGELGLADLFGDNRQLIIKHFMFGTDWDEGCVGCSFEMDHLQGALVHLTHHDVSFAAVSRAPFAKLEAFRRRMGWDCRWVSSAGSDFNRDFQVSFDPEDIVDGQVYHNHAWEPFVCEELSGFSVFYRDDDGALYRTFSAFGRGAEELLGTYVLLDMTPNGRNEPLRGNLTEWVRHHDRYDRGDQVAPSGRRETAAPADRCCG